MRWIPIILALFSAFVGLAFVLGSRLPRDHVATVRAKYRVQPEAIWALISDPRGARAWRKDLKSVEVLPLVDGKLAWREESGGGTVNFAMTDWDPPRRMTTRITSNDLPYGGQWEFSLVPSDEETELSITERGFVKPALFRFMARFFLGFTSSLEGYHRALGARLGEPVSPEVVSSGR